MAMPQAYRFAPSAVIRFTGEDHFDFLQGQGTADLRGEAGLCRYSLWLDHRGQIRGDGFVFREGPDSMLLVSHATPVGDLLAKFDRHIIADDVEMEDLTTAFEVVAVRGEDPESFLQSIGWDSPVPGRFQEKDSVRGFTGRRLGAGSLEFLIPAGMDFSLLADVVDQSAAEAMRLASGIPLVPVDTVDHTLNPLEANILSALSFGKGCYLGQEVVARVHRLGRMTRRLVRFEAHCPMSTLPREWMLDGNAVGGATSVVEIPDKCLGIGWLKSRCEDGRWTFDSIPFDVRTVPES